MTNASDTNDGPSNGGSISDSPDAFGGLDALMKAVKQNKSGKSLPPVHLWNPEYCGDIGMKIAFDGTWFYANSPIGRKELVTLFSTILRRDGANEFYLVTPVEKISIEVEDSPFVAVEMMVDGTGKDQLISLRTNVDEVVSVGAEHPMRFEVEDIDGGLKPYVDIRSGLEARVARSLYYDLVEGAVIEEVDGVRQFGVWSGGQFFVMCLAEDIEHLTEAAD